MNDDDDEVRDVAAAATEPILGKSLIPLAASDGLLKWLACEFGHLPHFQTAVANRLVGHGNASTKISPNIPAAWVSAETQLAAAMHFDDSLFVIEEQNLFVDEVRETKRWISAFKSISFQPDTPVFVALKHWVVGGLDILETLSKQDDGPIGWSSKPEVFAICMRIVHCAKAFPEGGHNLDIGDAVERILAQGRVSRLHRSLLEVLEEK
jgi:hypothetical protein